jgi:plasmid maintenance system antidote protein VapI
LKPSPQFWLSLQAVYDLRTAEEALGEKIQALPSSGVFA